MMYTIDDVTWSEQIARENVLAELICWVKERIEAEVTHRPDINIHKRTLSTTWNQVLRKLENFQ